MNPLIVSFGDANSPAVITKASRIPWPQFAEWLTATPPEVADKSARGWYCPIEFDPVYRHGDNFVARYALTFDFDHVTIDTWGAVVEAWEGLAFAIYTTFTHTVEAPRFRVVMPLTRPVSFDEYQAVARKLAADVGIELVAAESFVPAQMMYAPTRKLGGLHTSQVNDGAWLNPDEVLAEYANWTDMSSWPRRKEGDRPTDAGEKVDPCDKPGIIGEFNRAFTISEAIEYFDLPFERVQ